jgi:8-oxo-dGTP pyrophosphatase MutT (NUDIX family)
VTRPKVSRCAFVIVKLRIEGSDYYLMREDDDWKDVTFIGGHVSERDAGKLERTARRELREEVPATRTAKNIQLTRLTEELEHGPVYSKSAKTQVVYDIGFYLLSFGTAPKDVLSSLGPRTPNLLVHQDELLRPRKRRVAELVRVLAEAMPGGLNSIPLSWPEDMGSMTQGRNSPLDQGELLP